MAGDRLERVAGLGGCSLDLGRGHGHAVAVLEGLLGGDGLAIDADQEVGRMAIRELLLEEVLHGGAFGDLDVIRKPVKLSTNVTVRTRLQNRT